MEELNRRRWVIVLFFLFIGALLVAFIYAAIVGPHNPYYRSGTSRNGSHLGASEIGASQWRNIQLYKDRVRDLGKVRLIYHGLEGDLVNIGVIIPALDPDVSYDHKIPIQEAKNEVNLGGMRFRVSSIGNAKLRLERIDGSE